MSSYKRRSPETKQERPADGPRLRVGEEQRSPRLTHVPQFSDQMILILFKVYRLNRENKWTAWQQALIDETNRIFEQLVRGEPVRTNETEIWLDHVASSLKGPFKNQEGVRLLCFWGYQGLGDGFLIALNRLAERLLAGQDPLGDASKSDLAKSESASYLFEALELKQTWKARMPDPHKGPRRPTRSQAGYTPPGKAGKVILKTMVDPNLRDDFHDVAEALGITSQMLLLHLAKSTVDTAKSDPSSIAKLRSAIERDAQRSGEARNDVLKSVSGKLLKHGLA